MSTVQNDAVLIKLLDLLDCGQSVRLVPVVLLHESSKDVREWGFECVSELEDGRVILSELRVGKTFVYFTSVHFLLLA